MNAPANDLSARKCRPSAELAPLAADEVAKLLALLDGWTVDGGTLEKTFRFPSYEQTIAFVNAIAWVAQREDHHPDLHMGYSSCRIAYSTHAIGGLSENDFICAAKVEALLRI